MVQRLTMLLESASSADERNAGAGGHTKRPISMTTVENDTPERAELWKLRVDLAAAHRMAAMHNFNESIFNHFTAVLPAVSDRFLTLPFGRYWSEATASELLEVSFDGKVLSGMGHCERTAYCIHGPVHLARPDAVAVLHTHMPYASALTRLEDPRLKPIGQTEVSLIGDIAYDSDYQGFADTLSEGERLARAIGDRNILFMANHGVLVLGRSVAEAYDRLYNLERACQVQLYAMWTGQPLRLLPQNVATATQTKAHSPTLYDGKPYWELHFEALKRVVAGPYPKRFDE
jgi:ribulose-5-phosphate 4-epimerase/fuculose-1-phosphate aldolase